MDEAIDNEPKLLAQCYLLEYSFKCARSGSQTLGEQTGSEFMESCGQLRFPGFHLLKRSTGQAISRYRGISYYGGGADSIQVKSRLADRGAQSQGLQSHLVARESKIVMFWMASGTFYGLAANGNRSKGNGSTFAVVFCTSAFRLDKLKVCSRSCSKRWSDTMSERKILAGNGNPSTV